MNKDNLQHLLSKKERGFWSIYEEKDKLFSIRALIVPKGNELPLHDHPDMFVITKVLKGKLELTSFNFSNEIA